MSLPERRLEPLTPAEEARDSLDSYNEAVRVIGERVKAGAPIPDFMQSQQGAAMSELPALIPNGGGLPDLPRFRNRHTDLLPDAARKDLLNWLRPRQLEFEAFTEHFLTLAERGAV